ncbi:MAG: creatininase family protein, partial [Thermoprotei archaeon]
MKLHELTYKEVKIFLERGVDTFILPVGTIEPHGPHLPLGTDAFIPEKIGEILPEKIKAVLLPTIYYGVTGSLHGYPGSIRIEPEVLEQLIYQVLKSMSFHG